MIYFILEWIDEEQGELLIVKMEFHDFYDINGWNIVGNKIGKIKEKYRFYEEGKSIYGGWLERLQGRIWGRIWWISYI